MKVAIHQPQYLTWLGFFNKCLNVDLLVLLDNVQFQKNGFQNRTQIKAPPEWQWLTVPVSFSHPAKIVDVKIDNSSRWREKQWKTLVQNYQSAPYFQAYAEKLNLLFMAPFENLVDLNIKAMEVVFELLGIRIPVVRASSLKSEGNKTDLLMGICQEVGADEYLSGIGGRQYMEEEVFERAGIKVVYQEFNHPIYEQQYINIPFQPNMSVVDLLFNCGPKSKEIIISGYQPMLSKEIQHVN